MIRSETLQEDSVIAASLICSSDREVQGLGEFFTSQGSQKFDSRKLVRYQEHLGEKRSV